MIPVARLIAGVSASGVAGLMGFHIATGPNRATVPEGIASTIAQTAEVESGAPPVKANVVVFRKVNSAHEKFNGIVAAHEFEKATDESPARGWCYVEVRTDPKEPLERKISLRFFEGETMEDNPIAIRGFSLLGLDLPTLNELRERCPWSPRR